MRSVNDKILSRSYSWPWISPTMVTGSLTSIMFGSLPLVII